MKHIIYKTRWSWDTEKYPRYHVFLYYGRHLHESAEIPVMGGLTPDKNALLPENKFRLAKGKNGKLLILPGEDTTNRAFLMTSIEAGHRGSCGIDDGTTATVLVSIQTGNACSGSLELAALIAEGQQLILWSDGTDGTSYVVYTYDGENVTVKGYSPEEWEFVNSPYYLGDDEDVLFL